MTLTLTLELTLALALGGCTSLGGEGGPVEPVEAIVVSGANGSVRLFDRAATEIARLDEGGEAAVGVQATPAADGSVVWTAGTGTRLFRAGETRDFEAGFLPFYYAWSPDSSRVVMLGNSPNGGVAGAVLDAETGDIIPLGEARPFFLDWSADSGTIAAHLDSARLDLISPDGLRTGTAIGTGPYQAPAWLADGRVVAATGGVGLQAAAGQTNLDPVARLSVFDLDDGSEMPLADLSGLAIFEPSPDGSRVAMIEGTGPIIAGSLQVYPVDGSEPQPVIDEPVVMLEWSPDGTRLLLTVLGDDALEPMVWDGSNLRRYPGYIPTATLANQYLPFWGQFVRSITAWSPGSDAFTYVDGAEGDGVVMLQLVEADEPVELVPGEFAGFVPSR